MCSPPVSYRLCTMRLVNMLDLRSLWIDTSLAFLSFWVWFAKAPSIRRQVWPNLLMIYNLPRLRIASSSINLLHTYTSTARWHPLCALEDGTMETFREKAFIPSKPALLPKAHFIALPSIQKWFHRPPQEETGAVALNHSYLSEFGDAIVPLEFTRLSTATQDDEDSFQRAEVPFYIFLEWTKSASLTTPERLYLAQASFASLPAALKTDLPTPEIVAKSGTGDIYDTNIWMGIPPTYTPLHRDPNPNLFVQLAGHKIVRILPPETGDKVFAQAQNALGRSGSTAFRGEDMMKGEERRLLEDKVWNDKAVLDEAGVVGYEAHVGRGDGISIPKGWWHSVKGVGGGITGSVNWWFRWRGVCMYDGLAIVCFGSSFSSCYPFSICTNSLRSTKDKKAIMPSTSEDQTSIS